MTYKDLRVTIADGIAELTLDRPSERNAFSGAMAASLTCAYRECDGRDDVRAVIVTGAGPTFCVGADLGAGADTFARRDEPEFSADPLTFPAWEVRKPVIAAVNGHAVGIGLTLAMQCDIRLVASEAKLAFAHVRRGVLPRPLDRAEGDRFRAHSGALPDGTPHHRRGGSNDRACEPGAARRGSSRRRPRGCARHRSSLRAALCSTVETTALGKPCDDSRGGRSARDRISPPRHGSTRHPRRCDGVSRTPPRALGACRTPRLAGDDLTV
jgi:hypothetical protein